MLKKELCAIGKLYAVSPVHAGSGATTSAVDLPIQRERHTEWPQIQASGVKGALRDHFRKFNGQDKNLINLIFGSDEGNDAWDKKWDALPGAMSISDARLFAFPMRSNIAPFAWVTCPCVLRRFNADLAYLKLGKNVKYETVQKESARSLGTQEIEGRVIIEDTVVKVEGHNENQCIKDFFPELERLLLISDEMYQYAVTCCTEIQTHIKINAQKGTAKDGALRYKEYLPADSVLYSLVYYSNRDMAENNNEEIQKELAKLKAQTIKGYIEDTIKGFVQIGGDETLGKGIFKLSWISGGDV